jgi:transposase
MTKIRVHSPFRFTPETGEAQDFAAGVHHVSEEVAKHWFVQAHAEILDATKEKIPADYDAELTELRATLEDRDAQIAELKQQLEDSENQRTALMLQVPPGSNVNTGGKNGGNKK